MENNKGQAGQVEEKGCSVILLFLTFFLLTTLSFFILCRCFFDVFYFSWRFLFVFLSGALFLATCYILELKYVIFFALFIDFSMVSSI